VKVMARVTAGIIPIGMKADAACGAVVVPVCGLHDPTPRCPENFCRGREISSTTEGEFFVIDEKQSRNNLRKPLRRSAFFESQKTFCQHGLYFASTDFEVQTRHTTEKI
jgi:hypothetical protein